MISRATTVKKVTILCIATLFISYTSKAQSCNAIPNFSAEIMGCKKVFLTLTSSPTGQIDESGIDWGDGSKITGITSRDTFTHFYTDRKTYNITVEIKDKNGCTDDLSKPIQLPPVPIPAFLSSDVCLGEFYDFPIDLSKAKNLSYVDSFYVNYDDGTVGSSDALDFRKKYKTQGIYNITLTKMQKTRGRNCVDVDVPCPKLSVRPRVNVDFSIPDTVCENQLFKALDLSTLDTTVIKDLFNHFRWDFGDGTIFTSSIGDTSHSYSKAGEYTVTLTVTTDTGQCASDTSKTIYVCPKPKVQFTTSQRCINKEVMFENLTVDTSCCGKIAYFIWEYGDNNSSKPIFSNSSVFHAYDSPGNYKVKLTGYTASMLKYVDSAWIWVSETPQSQVLVKNTCDNKNADFKHTIKLSKDSIASVTWLLGNSDSKTRPFLDTFSYSYSKHGDYSATCITTTKSGCKDTVSGIKIEVYPSPIAEFKATSTCNNRPVKFTNNSTIDVSASIDRYIYEFGDGQSSNIQSPSHYYDAAKKYEPSLIITSGDGCRDTHSISLTIFPVANAAFNTSIDTVGCRNNEINFTDKTIGVSGYKRLWDFDNTDTSTVGNPKFTFKTTGFKTITLFTTTGNNCLDTAQKVVEIIDEPKPDFSLSQSIGCTPLSVVMELSSPSVHQNYRWIVLNDTIQDSTKLRRTFIVNQSFSESYTIRLESENKCGNKSFSKSLTVSPKPSAGISISQGVGSFCEEEDFVFKSTSSGDPDSLIWYLDANDTRRRIATGQNDTVKKTLSYTQISPGSKKYVITIEAKNGCDQDFESISVNAISNNVTASFDLSYNSSLYGCVPHTIELEDNSINATSVQYYMGEGTARTLNSVGDKLTHTYKKAGAYIISQAIKGCGTDSVPFDDTVLVYELPKAEILNLPFRFCANTLLTLNASGNNLTKTWLIDTTKGFLTADTFRQNAPEITFSTPVGKSTWYYIKLNVKRHELTGPVCENEVIDSILIVTHPKALVSPISVSQCQPFTSTFTNKSAHSTSRVWTMLKFNKATNRLDTLASNSQYDQFNNTFRNTTDITERYRLLLTVGNNVCFDTISSQISIHPQPTSEFSFILLDSNVKNCNSKSTMGVQFKNKSTNASEFLWKFGDGDSSLLDTARHTYQLSKTQLRDSFRVTLKAINKYGCTHTSDSTVIILLQPRIKLDTTTRGVCQDNPITFSPETVENRAKYRWVLTNGSKTVEDTGSTVTRTFGINQPRGSVQSEPWDLQFYVSFSNGCNDSLEKPIRNFIEVYHLPQARIRFAPRDTVKDDCYKNGRKRMAFRGDSSTNTFSYAWDFDNGRTGSDSIENSVYQLPAGTIEKDYYPKLKVENALGCADSTYDTINVKSAPIMEIDTNIRLLCEGDSNCFQPKITQTQATYHWYFDDGISLKGNRICRYFPIKNPNHSKDVEWIGMRFVSVLTNGCRDTIYLKNHVGNHYLPIAHASSKPRTTPDDGTDCYDEGKKPMTLNGTASIHAKNYDWDFDNGRIGSDSIENSLYQLPAGTIETDYYPKLKVENALGCSDSTYDTINVKSSPIMEIDTNGRLLCEGDSNCFLPKTTQAQATYHWYFDDGISLKGNRICRYFPIKTPNHSKDVEWIGMRLVSVLTNGCRDTVYLKNHVGNHYLPIAHVEAKPSVLTADTTNCYRDGRKRMVFKGSKSQHAQNHSWDFGNGANGAGLVDSTTYLLSLGEVSKSFTTVLTVENALGCKDTAQSHIEVKGKPLVSFYAGRRLLCEQDTVCFQAKNPHPGARYTWKFSNGDSIKGNSICYNLNNQQSNDSVGFLGLKLIARYSNTRCADSFERKSVVKVYDLAKSKFSVSTVNPTADNCYYNGIKVFKFDAEASTNAHQHFWDFGDGQTASTDTVTHTYKLGAGVIERDFTVTHIATNANGCSDSTQHTVNVRLKPNVWFDDTDTLKKCEDSSACFKAGTLYPSAVYDWKITGNDPNYEKTGSSSTFCTSLAFSANTGLVYKMPFDVSLAMKLANGCSDEYLSENHLVIYEHPVVDFSYTRDEPEGLCYEGGEVEVSFNSSQTKHASQTIWTFGDGISTTEANPQHTYRLDANTIENTYLVQLEARNELGCESFGSTSLLVKKLPEVDFDDTEINVCEEEQFCLTPRPEVVNSFISNYSWQIDARTVGDEEKYCGTVSTTTPESYYDAGLTITLGNGCSNSLIRTQHITVRKKPSANFIVEDVYAENEYGEMVAFGLVQLKDISTTLRNSGDLQNHWLVPDNNPGSFVDYYDQAVVYPDTFSCNRTKMITLTIVDINECEDDTTMPVTPEFFYGLYVPNALAPEVAVNEAAVFFPKGKGLLEYKLIIYDANGREVFQSSEIDSCGSPTGYWDGKYNDQFVPQGIYYWNITARFANGKVWKGSMQGNSRHSSGKIFLLR